MGPGTRIRGWRQQPVQPDLNTRCVTCHNHYRSMYGLGEQFFKMPEGIGVKRCHGPGALHVKTKLAGEIIDTSRYADRTIVNPRRHRGPGHRPVSTIPTSGDRCPGRTNLFDFKPGEAQRWNVFLPDPYRFGWRIAASQADRLRLNRVLSEK